jgi:hypothetical protein
LIREDIKNKNKKDEVGGFGSITLGSKHNVAAKES